MKWVLPIVAWVSVLAACPPVEEEPTLAPKLSTIHEEVFMPRCSANACHGGPGPSAQLDLEREPYASLVDAPSDADESVIRVVPGDPDASLLYLVLVGDSHGVRQMPVGGALEDFEVEGIKTWIEDGAEDN